MKNCKICDGNLDSLLAYNKMPKAAQYFPDSKTIPYDLGIPLEIYQCMACGTVQVPAKPVSYYSHAIRSPSWDTDPFRKRQMEQFVEEFQLSDKRIMPIEEEPKPDTYNAFLMFNYLEHFPEPRKTLTQIYNNLEEPGVGIVEVPNFDEIIRDRIFGEFIIDHLFYFTRQTLRFICEASGFDVLRIQEIWEGASLSAVVKKRQPLTALPFIENQKQLVRDIDNFVASFESATIWEAGHQTLMMLTMMERLDKIPYIVDSFTEKQHKYTHVTHKPVVPPEQLITQPVGGIAVIVGWQYREVLQHIGSLNLKPKPTVALIKKAALEIL
ncbi:MAG: methyltransferase domain-containing protein [Sedimentisphaerales bacterium]|nr:methyltransferase domain-containing protein [Sedimentisphaerales bacterium]